MRPSNATNRTNSKSIIIENFFHDTGNGAIFCTLLRPQVSNKECIIYFSPLFEERMWSQRIAFNFARDLVTRGQYSVLLFDYYGYGESHGDAEDFTLNRCRQDIVSLLTLLQTKGYQRFAIWGIRTGCAIALFLLPDIQIISFGFFWAPVLNLHKFIYDGLRATMARQYMLYKKNVATRDTILEELTKTGFCRRDGYVLNFIEGYRFSNDFYQETVCLGGTLDFNKIYAPVLVINVSSGGSGNKESSTQNENVQKPLQEKKNIEIRDVVDRHFWVIGNNYSQRADKFYESTFKWLGQILEEI